VIQVHLNNKNRNKCADISLKMEICERWKYVKDRKDVKEEAEKM
jgi:hypothetical protein